MNQETEANTIGRRIAMLRKEKGYTQEQLAEMLNISPQAVSKWENDISSPDISLIPKIAEILGVTTDELLGVTPLEPHVVVVDTGSAHQGQKVKGAYEFRFEGGKASAIIFGIFLLAIGAMFLLKEFGVISLSGGVTFWSIVWPIMLIGLGVSMLRESWFPVSVGCILVGAYKLLYQFAVIPEAYPLTWNMVWPLALLLIGLSIVTTSCRNKKRNRYAKYAEGHANKEPHVVENCEDGVVHLECNFSETRHNFEEDVFRGADIEGNFGTITLDLRQCKQFSDSAYVDAEVNFGSLNVLLPPTVALNKKVDNTFAVCTVKGNPNADAPYRLTVRGSVNFGSIEIRY